jgi:GT2 family glycosyltransferase
MNAEPTNEIQELLARQERLEKELAEMRRHLLAALERQESQVDRLDQRLSHVQARAAVAYQEVRSIMNSRTWRTLVKMGGVALNLGRWFRSVGRAHLGGEGLLRLRCEEPASEGPFSGVIRISGWAVSSAGIDRVELRLGDANIQPVRFGLYRPDVAKHYPEAAQSDRCGFFARLDTLALPNGLHTIYVSAVDRAGRRAQVPLEIEIDHRRCQIDDYSRWINEFEIRDPEQIRVKLASFAFKPLISILVPVYRTRPAFLERAIRSVLAQSYPHWELCLVDDCSMSPEIDALLAGFSAADSRVRFAQLSENSGISAASNVALEMARGEFIGLLDHDDELAEDALFHVVDAINHEPEADILYSDEDHIDDDGRRSDPFFKPDWSPYTILSENYVTHLMVLRREIALSCGGFRSEADLSQDHDILLRASLKARRIVHIPRILYHWRTNLWYHRSTRASDSAGDERIVNSQREALECYLRTAGIEGAVEPGRYPDRWRVRYPLPQDPPRVATVIPCGGRMEMLTRCIETFASITKYPNYEIWVVDNSRAAEVEAYAKACAAKGLPIHHVDWRNRRFNYSAMNNDAAALASAPLLLFLNDDICIVEPEWLTAMVELATRPNVGAVGARLLFPDGRIQHAGLVVGMFGVAGHAFKGCFGDERTYFDFPDIIRDVSAVTAACMLVRRDIFEKVGGFDEKLFPVAYNDVDLCLKIRQAGYRVVYTPHATLHHYEAVSKAPEDIDPRPEETAAFRAKWQPVIDRDPFYNPNLTLDSEDYALRKRPNGGPHFGR